MTLTIELPDIYPLKELDEVYLRQMLLCNLYNLGKLSAREAREALGLSRRAFEDLLTQFGLAILSDSDSTLSAELNA